MSKIESYRDLVAWQAARKLAHDIYRVTKPFPTEERYGLTSQLRRGAISVISNIAEGYGRGSTADYARFLRVARGALFELEAQLIIAEDLSYLSSEDHRQAQAKVDGVARPLSGLIRSIEKH